MSWFTEILFLIPNWAWFVIIVGIFCILMAIVIVTCCSKKGDRQNDKNSPEPVLMDGEADREEGREKHEEVKAEEVKKEEKVVYTEPEPVLVEEPVQPIKKEAAKKSAPQKTTTKKEEKPAEKTTAKTSAKPTEKKPAAKSTTAKSEKTAAAKSATKSTAAKTTPKTTAKPAKAEDNDNKVYHISKRKEDKKWQVKAEGSAKALKLFFTQDEAIDYAKSVAGNQEGRIVIHKEDGGFRKLKY